MEEDFLSFDSGAGFGGISDVAPLDFGGMEDMAGGLDDSLQQAFQSWLDAGNVGTIQDFLSQASASPPDAALAVDQAPIADKMPDTPLLSLDKAAFEPAAATGAAFGMEAPAPQAGSFAMPAPALPQLAPSSEEGSSWMDMDSPKTPNVGALAFNPQSYADSAPQSFSRVGLGDNLFAGTDLTGPLLKSPSPEFSPKNAGYFVDTMPSRQVDPGLANGLERIEVDRPNTYSPDSVGLLNMGGQRPQAAPFSREIAAASRETGIPENLLRAKIMQESAFNPNARGAAGEIGLTQIMPKTARDPGWGVKPIDPEALRDPEQNIMFGARYLAARGKAAGVTDWNDPKQAAAGLTAYNGGGDPNYASNVMRYAAPGDGNRLANVPPMQSGEGAPMSQRSFTGYARAQEEARQRPENLVELNNTNATRNLPISDGLKTNLQKAVGTVYGPGYRAQVYSGGQPALGTGGKRIGSTRHDDGNAADVYIVGPDGNRVTGDGLVPLARYWRGNNLGGVGMEMRGGGIHLDTHTDRAPVWSYGRLTPGQQAFMSEARSGNVSAFAPAPQSSGQQASARPSPVLPARDPSQWGTPASESEFASRSMPSPRAAPVQAAAPITSAPQGRQTMPQISPDEELYSLGMMRDPAGGGMIQNVAIRPPGMAMGSDGAYVDAGSMPAAAPMADGPAGFGGFGGIATTVRNALGMGGGEAPSAPSGASPAPRSAPAAQSQKSSWFTPQMDAFLGGLSAALMSNNGSAFAPAYQAILASADKKAETAADKAAIAGVLQKYGLPPDEAATVAASPSAAQMAVQLMQQQREAAQMEAASRRAEAIARGETPQSAAPAAPEQAPPPATVAPPSAPPASAPAQNSPGPMQNVEAQRASIQARINQLRTVKGGLKPSMQGPYEANIKNLEDQLKALPDPLDREKKQLEIDKMRRDLDTNKPDKIKAEIEARRQAVIDGGNDPKDARWQEYIYGKDAPGVSEAEKAAQKQIGEAQGKAAAAAPRAIALASDALKSIEGVRKHPAFNSSVFGGGLSAPGTLYRKVPGTDAYDFNLRVEQLKGKTFLEAYEGLRGGGAISEPEGAKATVALGRLDAAQSPKDFKEALDDLESVIVNGLKVAKEMGAKFGTVKPEAQSGSMEGKTAVNPKTGERLMFSNGKWVPAQ